MSAAKPDDHAGTAERLREMLGGYRVTQILHVAARLRIADALAAGPRPVGALAADVEADPGALHRLLRALASLGVLTELDADREAPVGERRFELAPLGEPLRRDHPDSVHPFAVSYGQPWWWDVYGRLGDSVRTGATAFERAYGVGLFEYLALHPEAERIFAANMTAMTEREGHAVSAAWDPGDAETVVDVGGGQGALLARLLQDRPGLRGVLFDLPTVIEDAGAPLERAGVDGRCELRAGSFFDGVPEGSDAYFLKDVLHDWQDDDCVAILSRCREAMAPGARLVVVERPLPVGGGPSVAKLIDLNMLVLTGGRERTEREYRHLLRRAGLRPTRTTPAAEELALMEAEPE